ncbi:ribonuclease H-like domain-containing protein [Tanacetum coccineum]
MMFLMRLNDVYQNIRSNILARDPLPDVKEAFNVVSREESHRGLHSGSGSSSGNKVQPAAFVVKPNNYKGNDFKKGNSNNNNSSNRGPNPNLLCKNYGLIEHTIERCYEIIGYPAGFKRNLNLSRQGGNSNTKVFNGNSEAQKGASSSSGSTNFDTPFTKDQMMKILSLINEKPTGNASANMAGMRPTFYNGNAMFNLHFEKFFSAQTCSYMYNLSMGWIIDSGANQHFTVSTKNMFNVTDISGVNLTVGHPNGTLAKISAIENLRLTSNVVLFDVLVIPEYNAVLLRTAGRNKGSLSLSDHKSVALGDLVHLDLWGPYKVVSKDGYRLPSSVLSGSSPYLLVYGKEPNLSHIRCFDCLCYSTVLNNHDKFSSSHTSEIPYDDEREQSKDDGNSMAPNNINSSQVVDEDATFATSLTENANISEGQHGTDASIPRIISNGLNSSNSRDEPQTMRKSDRLRSLPSKFNDYVMPSNKKYGIEKHVNYSKLSPVNMCFTSNLNKSSKPKSLQEAMLDNNWIKAMNNEMEALLKNKTWVLVDLPPNRKTIGYYDPSKTRVCKLVKSIYGLKQAHRQWNEKLTSVLNEHGFVHSINDYSMFVKHDYDNILILLVYVDDIVITGSNLDEIKKFKRFLTSKFQIKDLGSLKYFLGIEVLKNKNGLCLSQTKYCMELLSEYELLACKPVATPMQHNVSLSHIETERITS